MHHSMDPVSISSFIDNKHFEFRSRGSWGIAPEYLDAALIEINPKGQLLADGVLILGCLNSCKVRILTRETLSVSALKGGEIFLECKDNINRLVASLMLRQNLITGSLPSKWFAAKSIVHDDQREDGNELLICRFRVFGPMKVRGSKETIPLYSSNVPERWFDAIGHLKGDGILDLLAESDGSLIYSVDVTSLYSEEIRQVDHSLFQNSNTLFLGIIPTLREQRDCLDKKPFLPQSTTQRIVIQFPLHIDLEDWLVTLKSFSQLEYYGTNDDNKLRISRTIVLEIVEANISVQGEYYSEVTYWDAVWCKTATSELTKNPFWKEKFSFDLPITCPFFTIEVKGSNGLVGSVKVDEECSVSKLSLLDSSGVNRGYVLVNLTVSRHEVLPHDSYKTLENMLKGMPLGDLASFFEQHSKPDEKLEYVSGTLLDVFQVLNRESDWLGQLMDHELARVDSLTRSTRVKNTHPTLNGLFRGNSMLTKSLEKYALRTGREYLELVVGSFVRRVVEENKECELDSRVLDDKEKIRCSSTFLLEYMERLWNAIYTTSNDLPDCLKAQWSRLRYTVEKSVDPKDTEAPLNALTAFIFLRFLCPAILNPKLFNLTNKHQAGKIQRTLTLVAKILLTLSNRSRFTEHKEPFLICMNEFLETHETELLDYMDKITGRKLDFSPKVLELSNSVSRASLRIPKYIADDLPTSIFLIDKNLCLNQLVSIICDCNKEADRHMTRSDSRFQIGSLDFEEQLTSGDGHFGSDIFLDDLLKTASLDGNDFAHFVKQNITLRDLQNQAFSLKRRTIQVQQTLELPESPELMETSRRTLVFHRARTCASVDAAGCIVYGRQSEFLKGFDKAVHPNIPFNSGAESKNVLRKLFKRKQK